MKFTFFAMNDFSKEGGGTIRMLGILNELAKSGNEVFFVSNTKDYHKFHPNIEHHFIDHSFSPKDKRIFQAMLATCPVSVVNLFYSKLLKRLKNISNDFFINNKVYFFEYLDNSIGYWLKKNKLISAYINDLHGVATLEFKFQADTSNRITESLKFKSKYLISNLLDEKVFNGAEGLIFASKAMEDFFIAQYPSVAFKKNYLLPYVLSPESCEKTVNKKLKEDLIRKFQITTEQKIIFFAGAFKKTGGVPDLIEAFSKITSKYPSKLLLVGDGPTFNECVNLTRTLNIEDRVTFIGRIPYDDLRTYQNLADIIVCPDKQNVYSELIVHVKYLDALISEKVVINGSFKSVLEINTNESLSVNFVPSDIGSLAKAMNNCLNNMEQLKLKYSNNKSFACEHLTYKSFVSILK